jgi:hypothetical protein
MSIYYHNAGTPVMIPEYSYFIFDPVFSDEHAVGLCLLVLRAANDIWCKVIALNASWFH